MTIGEKIRYFRMRRKLTQQELGEKIGLQGTSAGNRIAQYESGYRSPKSDRLEAIAEALGVSPDDLSPTTGPVWNITRCTNTSHAVNAQTLTELNTMINALYRWQNSSCIDEEILSEVDLIPVDLAQQLSKIRSMMFGDALDWDVLCKQLSDMEGN